MHWSSGSMFLFALVLSSHLFNQVTLKPYYLTGEDNRDASNNMQVAARLEEFQDKIHLQAPNISHIQTGLANIESKMSLQEKAKWAEEKRNRISNSSSEWELLGNYYGYIVQLLYHQRHQDLAFAKVARARNQLQGDKAETEDELKKAESMLQDLNGVVESFQKMVTKAENELKNYYYKSIQNIQKFAQTKMAQARIDLQAGKAGAESDLKSGELVFREAKDRGDAFQKLITVQEDKLKNYYYKEGAKNVVGAVSGIVASLSGAYALGWGSKAAWDYLFRNGSVTSESVSNVTTVPYFVTTVISENFINFRVILAILAVLVVLCIGGTLLANRFGLFNRLAVQEGETLSTGETGITHSTNSSNGVTLSKKVPHKKAPSKKATHSTK